MAACACPIGLGDSGLWFPAFRLFSAAGALGHSPALEWPRDSNRFAFLRNWCLSLFALRRSLEKLPGCLAPLIKAEADAAKPRPFEAPPADPRDCSSLPVQSDPDSERFDAFLLLA